MNIFLPYEDDIVKIVQSLDDVRLQKQAVEVYQLLTLAIKEQQEGHEVKAGHYHHPVYLFYKDNIPFLAYYGYECCREYYYRSKKWHSLTWFFDNELERQGLYGLDADFEEELREAYPPPDNCDVDKEVADYYDKARM